MSRDVARLAESTFDVLVVGGGIHGLMAAYDAAQRGLSVALIERGDFGGATPTTICVPLMAVCERSNRAAFGARVKASRSGGRGPASHPISSSSSRF